MDIDPKEFKFLVERSRAAFIGPDRSALSGGHAWYYFITDILDGHLTVPDARQLLDDPAQIDGRLDEATEVLKQMVEAPTAMLQAYIQAIDRNTIDILRRVEQHSGDLGAVHNATLDLRAASADLISRVGNVERSTSVRTAVAIALTTSIATGLGTGLLSTWAYPHLFGPTPTTGDTTGPARTREGERSAAGSSPPATNTFRIDLGPLVVTPFPEIVLRLPEGLARITPPKDAVHRGVKRPVVKHEPHPSIARKRPG